jgi:hypothetical protein
VSHKRAKRERCKRRVTASPRADRFRSKAQRVSLPWLGSGEWLARNPLRFRFGPRRLIEWAWELQRERFAWEDGNT